MIKKANIRVWTGKQAAKYGFYSKVVKRVIKNGFCSYKGKQYEVFETPWTNEFYIDLK